MFSLVCALPSPASAEACASLFDWFTGTTAQSDFSSTCMSAVWFMAFADRSCSFEQDVREISRFSCMLFLSVRGFSDYAGPNSHSRNSVAAVLPSSISEGSRHPDPSAFRSSIARPTGTSGLRFTRHLTVPPARLEARMESLFSFPVGLFHPLQHAGLSRRTPSCRRHVQNRRIHWTPMNSESRLSLTSCEFGGLRRQEAWYPGSQCRHNAVLHWAGGLFLFQLGRKCLRDDLSIAHHEGISGERGIVKRRTSRPEDVRHFAFNALLRKVKRDRVGWE